MSKKALIGITILFFQFALLNRSSAQKTIKLKDVKSFTLVTKGGGLDGNYKKLEVSYVQGEWKCYQLWQSGCIVNDHVDSSQKLKRSSRRQCSKNF
ncbi:hypothetical protein [Mucilaginibacter sp.]